MSKERETSEAREMLERRVEESRRRMRRSFAKPKPDSWMKKKSDARNPGKKKP